MRLLTSSDLDIDFGRTPVYIKAADKAYRFSLSSSLSQYIECNATLSEPRTRIAQIVQCKRPCASASASA